MMRNLVTLFSLAILLYANNVFAKEQKQCPCMAANSSLVTFKKYNARRNYFNLAGVLDAPLAFKRDSDIPQRPDVNYAIDLGVGREIFSRFRLGLDYQYKPAKKIRYHVGEGEIKEWGYKSQMFLVRASYDLLENPFFSPYILAAGGISLLAPSDYYFTDNTGVKVTYKAKSSKNFAWKLGLGIRLRSWRRLDTFIEYNYINRGVIKTKPEYTFDSTTVSANPKKGDAKSHNLAIGISYNF